MSVLRSSRAVSCAAAAMLAGCGGWQLPNGMPGAIQVARSAPQQRLTSQPTHGGRYEIIYNFKNSPDGRGPEMTLVAIHGMLYGTTVTGGAHGDGTVFVVSPSGKERVIYSFKGPPDDGIAPYAGLTEVNGKLYGTTKYGGLAGASVNSGTVFELTTSGKERVLHNFTGAPDGALPAATLTVANGALYGTTEAGGLYSCSASSSSGYIGCGAVFTVTLSGKERVLHRFRGAKADGARSLAPLLAMGTDFYSTTSLGGAENDGTVYEISNAGKARIIYSFKGEPDGSNPLDGLTQRGDVFFATTSGGGAGIGSGAGTLFKIGRTGRSERTIYDFGSQYGSSPSTGVVVANGQLYGTALGPGHGTVYEIGPSGQNPELLHQFKGAPDGDYPDSSLTLVNGVLYGTTAEGGNCGYHTGCGVVFKVVPR